MNDEQLKNLLQKDNSAPKASPYEWQKIERSLNKKGQQESSWFSSFKLALTACSLIVCFIAIQKISVNSDKNVMTDQELVEYMFEDGYLESSNPNNDPLYAWID